MEDNNKKITFKQYNVIAGRIRHHGKTKSVDWDKLWELDRMTASDIIKSFYQSDWNFAQNSAIAQLRHLGMLNTK